jgi:hypothetical protein
MVLWRKRENGQEIRFEDGLVEAGKRSDENAVKMV